MNKKWIKFLSEYTQKAVGDAQAIDFKVGDVVEVDEKIAKSLIDLGLAEETTKPEDADLEPILKGFQDTLAKTVETALGNAFKNLGDKFEKSIPNFAQPRDKEAEGLRGFKSEQHFYKTVVNVGIAQKTGQAVNTDIIGVDAPELLIKTPTGQNISNDVEGGFTVPDVVANRIWTNMQEDPTSIMGLTDQYTTGGNSIKIPRIFESSRKAGTGKRHAGIQVAWLDEAEALTETKITTGKLAMELHKLGAVIYLTDEIIADSGFSYEGFFRKRVPQAINFEVTNACLLGSGVGKPLGCLKGDAAQKVNIQTRAGAAPSETGVLHYTLNQMYWRNVNRGSAVWYVHPTVAELLEFVSFDDQTTNKIPVYLPANLTNTPFGTLYGRPVVPFEHMEALGFERDMAFVDWSEYGTLTKAGGNGGVSVASSIHVRFLYEEMCVRFTYRVDGRPLWSSGIEDLNPTTGVVRSPYVFRGAHPAFSEDSGL